MSQNREIIFRGKRVDNNEWVTSKSIIQEPDEEGTMLKSNHVWVKVIPETVGQYTEIQALNSDICDIGEKIWSNSKVKFNNKLYNIRYAPGYTGGYILDRSMFEHGENEEISLDDDVAYQCNIVEEVHNA